MLGTQAKCPNMIKSHFFSYNRVCGCKGYTILKTGVFLLGSGYDPLARKVKCNECGHIYYIFPALNYKEEVSNVHNS